MTWLVGVMWGTQGYWYTIQYLPRRRSAGLQLSVALGLASTLPGLVALGCPFYIRLPYWKVCNILCSSKPSCPSVAAGFACG